MTSNRFTVAVIFVLFAVINVALGKKVQSNLLRSNLNKKVTHDNSDKLASVKDSKGEWIKCENGQRKKGLQRSACRLKKDGEGKEQEFNFQEFLLNKGCPKFGRPAIKESLLCFGDQSPCKEYDMEDLINAFEGCNKIKTARDNLKNNVEAGQNAFEVPDRTLSFTKPVTIFNENFANVKVLGENITENIEKLGISSPVGDIDFSKKSKWSAKLSTKYGVKVSPMLGSKVNNKTNGNALIFLGNKKGKSTETDGARYITTKPMDIRKGGVISFYLKDGPDDGDYGCLATMKEYRRKEAARIARMQNETIAKEKCANKPPCGGHGEGIYTSSCFKKGRWVVGARLAKDEFTCHNYTNQKCTCKCNVGYKLPDCKESSRPNNRDGYSRCRSVGDPHPNTANGAYFNIYDAGEFVWSRHPDVNIEAHLMTRPAGRVAVNKGMSIRKCTGGAMEDGKTVNKDGKMKGPCETVSMINCNFQVETADGKCMSKGRSFTTKLGIRVTHNTISVDGWSIQYSCGHYYDSYLTINSPRDGRSQGLCGYYGKQGAGEDRKNGNFLSSSGSRGRHSMTSRAFFNGPLTIKTGESSHFNCHGFSRPQVNGRYGFKRIMSTIASAKSMAKMDKAEAGMEMKMREQATTRMLKSYRAWSVANRKDNKDQENEVTNEEATKKCEEKILECSGLPVADAKAMEACVQDYIKVGREAGKMVLQGACDVVKEDEENAFEDVEADEKDEKLELVGEAALRSPSKNDLVVQWCVEDCTYPETEKCKEARQTMMENPKSGLKVEDVNKLCIWKQLKAFPAKLYAESGLTKDWRHMTMRVPQEAIDRTHKPANPRNKGQHMRLRFYQHAHDCFCCDTFGIDNIQVVTGGWPVRILADSSFTLYADGKKIGNGIYNEMKEIYRYRVDPQSKIFAIDVESSGKNRAGFIASIGDSVVSSSTWKCKNRYINDNVTELVQPIISDSNWGKAVELGTNEGEGTVPWGSVPGMASKAFWIYTHGGYMKDKSAAICRVDTEDAWHSYSKEHLGASRWSCKSKRNRQSPFSISLNEKKIKFAQPQQSADDNTLEQKVSSVKNSVISYNETGKVSAILVKLAIGDIVEKTEEGAMVKTAILRLFVTDPSAKGFKYCMNTRPWKANSVTFKSFNATVANGLADCKIGKAKNVGEFAALDISDWFRNWVSNRNNNFGITILHQGNFKDSIGFSTSKVSGEDVVQRPRLNLACHGDHVASDMVFKEKKAKLLVEKASSLRVVKK